jgi:hypothetical protein
MSTGNFPPVPASHYHLRKECQLDMAWIDEKIQRVSSER